MLGTVHAGLHSQMFTSLCMTMREMRGSSYRSREQRLDASLRLPIVDVLTLVVLKVRKFKRCQPDYPG
ncbi:hypothetical protein Y032_0022g566 [Ancylostoma ceylanicum]|uniref:Uncharacterized protein n=1 Tax=Ancylostoma ceylanicum TaxID=53326 RepID=A0A016V0N8_9BILA|nr:hypothetical protein Y032_0022g566 [Ancylostoma ceylanicum]